MKAAAAAVLAALALAACAPPQAAAPLPPHPLPAGPHIRISAQPVPQWADGRPHDACAAPPCAFTYAGGLELTSPDTTRLHGLSDLDIQPDGALVAVGDEGDLLRARLVLDGRGAPVGLTDARLMALIGLDGQPLQGKEWSDSEGLALMPNGDLLISFERHDRIWDYPVGGGPPHAAPSPDAAFPENSGMEALAPDPDAGPDAYIAAGEDSGDTWSCRLTASCVAGPKVDKPVGFGVVAVRRLPAGRTAWLLRAWDPIRGSRIRIDIVDRANRLVARQTLERPATVDNFEGLSAVPQADGRIRFYLISDDNFSSNQRTLLLAFDWTPPSGS